MLVGDANGAYPSGNSLLVRGAGESDHHRSVGDGRANGVAHRRASTRSSTATVTRITWPATACSPMPGCTSTTPTCSARSDIDGLMEVYGLTGASRRDFERVVIEEFHYTPRPDAEGFGDGHVFDLGGGVRVEAVHLPGHTRGHSGFRIGEVFFLSDIDLTGFGPYYGDVWSDLDDFEASLVKVRDEEAEFYVTFHHKGVIEGRDDVRRAGGCVHRGHRSAPRGDARLPRRAAHDRGDGGAPVHLPPARDVGLRRVGRTPQRRSPRAAHARPEARPPRSIPAAIDVCDKISAGTGLRFLVTNDDFEGIRHDTTDGATARSRHDRADRRAAAAARVVDEPARGRRARAGRPVRCVDARTGAGAGDVTPRRASCGSTQLARRPTSPRWRSARRVRSITPSSSSPRTAVWRSEPASTRRRSTGWAPVRIRVSRATRRRPMPWPPRSCATTGCPRRPTPTPRRGSDRRAWSNCSRPIGYYCLISTLLNGFDIPLVEGMTDPFPDAS